MIDTNDVYKTVLFILNKEQRGYMTPAEFNKVAAQVQLEIFESYFDSLNQQLRAPQNDSEYGDRVKSIRDRISIFEKSAILAAGGNGYDAPTDMHRSGLLELVTSNGNAWEVQKTTAKQMSNIRRSKLTAPDLYNPVYHLFENSFSIIGGASTPGVQVRLTYIRKPLDPTWDYTTGTLGEYVHTGGQPFEISDVEQTEVVLRVLAYSGIIIRDPSIIQTASTMAAAEDGNEKS